jgi:hypothetical protein
MPSVRVASVVRIDAPRTPPMIRPGLVPSSAIPVLRVNGLERGVTAVSG